MDMKGTEILEKNLISSKRIVVNEGGARSSKTYSLCQLFLLKMFQEKNILISVVRKTGPALRATVYKDFIAILKDQGLYDDRKHNKSTLTYQIGTNEIEFFSLDDSEKVKGRKRDYLWVNEANELGYDDWQQLIMRTTKRAFLDYNPSEVDSWIYDFVLTREDCEVISSTYKDNPFLEKEVIQEIENLKEVDEEYWSVYGLGKRAQSKTTIYTNWELVDEMPEGGEDVYGQDFGYNAPSAMVHCKIKDEGIYVDELFYKKYHTNSMLMEFYENELKFPRSNLVYADGAEIQRIEEFKNKGFYMEPADKAPGSVKKGIDTLKSKKIYITKRSLNIIKEIKMYKWKMKDGKQLDEPVKLNDHAMDAMRYAIYTHLGQPYFGFA